MSSPTYTGLSKLDLLDSAMSQPLSLTSTLWQEGKGGALESFGLGTALRYGTLPEQAPVQEGTDENGNAIVGPGQVYVPPDVGMSDALMGNWGDTPAQLEQRRQQAGALTEDQYKASPSYRKDIPYDPGMTETRAAALAAMDDAKKVREFYAQKRPLAAFLGSMAGQALDPINYIPVGGAAVKAAAIGRFGRIGGEALAAGLDAAANTAVFGLGTAGMRAQLGDDVSWQALISQIATAGLIGSAFGTIHGAIGSRVDARLMSEAEQRLATLQTTQEARIALNEGIDALVRGEDVNLSPNSTEPLQRIVDDIATHGPPPQEVANSIVNTPASAGFSLDPNATFYHGGRADLQEFTDAFRRDGTPKDKYDVRGIYVTENRRLAEQYVGKDGKVHEVQIDAKNPVVLPDPRFPEIDSASLTAKDIEKLKAAGYDSVINKDRMEVALFEGKQVSHKALIAKQPSYELVRADHGDMGLPEPKPGVDERVYAIHRDGEPVGYANIEMRGDQAYVKDIYNTDTLDTTNSLGTSAVAQLLRQFVKENPGVRVLAGERVSGARRGGIHGLAGTGEHIALTLPRTRTAIDTAKPAPETRPEGIKQAEASVAKPEDTKALAAQYSVDPATGAFPEEAQVAQLATEGRLTPDDAVNLAQAEADYHAGASFGEALKSIVGCLI
jgi:hypothetical protein